MRILIATAAAVLLAAAPVAAEETPATPSPTLTTMRLSPTVDTIFGFRYEDFELLDYQSHPRITAPIAV